VRRAVETAGPADIGKADHPQREAPKRLIQPNILYGLP
jgi:hypothetical protein